MKKHWWKVLAAILVLYSLLIGMLLPLRPGIVSNKTSLRFIVGQENKITVHFYNARYQSEKADEIKARVRLTEKEEEYKGICAKRVEIKNDNELELYFDVPWLDSQLIYNSSPLLQIGSPNNGYVFSSVFLSKDAEVNQGRPYSEEDFCDVSPLPQKKGLSFPFLNILEETIRNLFYHVPMWFGMMYILLLSTLYSIRQLRRPDALKNDIRAKSLAGVGVLYGILGVVTGAIWAKYTWGHYWSWDIKQNSSAVALLIYLAYFVLRSSFDDADKKARISAVYNIFAFATLIPLLYVVPRLYDSLHPGAEGNPAFSSYDLDSNMRLVFYPAVLGWILFGLWLASIGSRIEQLRQQKIEQAYYEDTKS